MVRLMVKKVKRVKIVKKVKWGRQKYGDGGKCCLETMKAIIIKHHPRYILKLRF